MFGSVEDQWFWSDVAVGEPDECWPWRGPTHKGYGNVTRRAHGLVGVRAHRIAYFLVHGVWPRVVRHSCDNPPCCNPGHLLPGTQRDNVKDMHDRGRAADHSGEKNGRSKLTNSQRLEIVRLSQSDVSQSELARRYGVARFAIQKIIKKGTTATNR